MAIGVVPFKRGDSFGEVVLLAAADITMIGIAGIFTALRLESSNLALRCVTGEINGLELVEVVADFGALEVGTAA